MYPDDQVLVAIMNNRADWERVQGEGWYRIPAKKAPSIGIWQAISVSERQG